MIIYTKSGGVIIYGEESIRSHPKHTLEALKWWDEMTNEERLEVIQQVGLMDLVMELELNKITQLYEKSQKLEKS